MASPPGLINPQEVAAKCRKAMKGWGTDEKALTEVRDRRREGRDL